jgi:hypothetical protein
MQLSSVYLFDDPNDPGASATNMALDLEVGDPGVIDVATDADIAQQGAGYLYISESNATAGLTSSNAVYDVPTTGGFTYGGWFQQLIDTQSGQQIRSFAGRYEAGVGYLIRRRDNGDSAICYAAPLVAESPDASWLAQGWRHIVCRIDVDRPEVTVFVSGENLASDTATNPPTLPARPFRVGTTLGDPSSSLVGYADEVFFTRVALTDEEIARIHTCGIDGQQCICDPSEPTTYLHCGRMFPSCPVLPNCDARLVPR